MKAKWIVLVVLLALALLAGILFWPAPRTVDGDAWPLPKGDMSPWIWSKDAHGLPEELQKRQEIDDLKSRIPLPIEIRNSEFDAA